VEGTRRRGGGFGVEGKRREAAARRGRIAAVQSAGERPEA
jgi:hypothetical protein